MMASNYRSAAMTLLLILIFMSSLSATIATPIQQMIKVNAGNATFTEGGKVVKLMLNKFQASGFESLRKDLLFTRIDMRVKLPPGNSAGIVTTFYMSSRWEKSHDEIDIEFLGNVSGQPYTFHTNVYAQGQGNKEMQYKLWFDPSASFHTYTILWNTNFIIFKVDGLPVRAFPNLRAKGIEFPTSKPMGVFASIWNADDWATQGGRIKTDWKFAPFIASYRDLTITECSSTSKDPKCWLPSGPIKVVNGVPKLDSWTRNKIKSVEQNSMIYNYCTDFKRFPKGVGRECGFRDQI